MHPDKSRSKQRFTVKEAANRLNVSEAAIRQRVQREQIDYEKDEETNRVYILLDAAEQRLDDGQTTVEQQLINTLQEQLRLEREASAELRRIIAGLTQRIPAIEAPPGERESPETASQAPEGVEVPLAEDQRSWWRKVFGL